MPTDIQWTDEAWNPVTGCRKVSPGCKNCYAEGVADRFWATQYPPITVGDLDDEAVIERPRRFTDVQVHPDRLAQPLRWTKPRRVFVNSMSDLFHDDVPDAFIVEVFAVMAMATRHTFQILTKRPERMQRLITTWRPNGPGPFSQRVLAAAERMVILGHAAGMRRAPDCLPWPLPNVWLGVSVEDQERADERVPILLDTPAAVRFLSCEPLIGPVELTDLSVMTATGVDQWSALDPVEADDAGSPGAVIDWVIVGGESGPKARPMDLAWARSLVQQGRVAGVPVFVKQLGRHPYVSPEHDGATGYDVALRDSHGGDIGEWPEDLRVREFPPVAAA